MKILVTGGAGFIGSNFIHYWLDKYPADEVINYDALTYAGNLENLKEIKHNKNYKFVKGDIRDIKKLDTVLPGVDTVVHFAAESHVDNSITGPAVFVETNVLGTQVLLDACLRHKVRHFHHISTDEVFGSLRLGESKKFNENYPYDPHSPYAASKAASDHLVRSYGTTYGLKYTISNCSNNFGPFQHPEKFLPKVILSLLNNRKVPVYGDGLYVRDWLYVYDHCRAIDLILQKGKAQETYCVGGQTEDINNLELVRLILDILGKDDSMIEFVPDRPGHDRRYAVDWSKIKNELGFEPAYDFSHWLTETVKWYRENEWWWEKLIK